MLSIFKATPLTFETCLFIGYLIAGPLVWTLYGIGMFQGRRRMRLLKKPPCEIPQPPPRATILIPAKDEGERIRSCILSALSQNYPDFNVVAIDDRSVDCTGTVLDEIAAADPRLRVVHIQPGTLPEGWTGKNNALHTGYVHADGQWLLFVDSDVILQPSALAETLAMAENKRFDLVSLIPKMETHTIWESMLIPLASAAVGAVYMMALTNANASKVAFGNGQYMLIRRTAYEQAGGHVAVRDKFCEDMVMARIFKDQGLRPRMAWGTDLAAVRMYDSLPKILRGWSRIFFAASVGRPWRSLSAIVFLLLSCYSVYFAVGWGIYSSFQKVQTVGGMNWLLLAAIHWVLMTVQIGIMYGWQINPKRYALAFPIAGGFLLYILFNSVYMCITKKVEWRGTSYAHKMAPVPKVGG